MNSSGASDFVTKRKVDMSIYTKKQSERLILATNSENSGTYLKNEILAIEISIRNSFLN